MMGGRPFLLATGRAAPAPAGCCGGVLVDVPLPWRRGAWNPRSNNGTLLQAPPPSPSRGPTLSPGPHPTLPSRDPAVLSRTPPVVMEGAAVDGRALHQSPWVGQLLEGLGSPEREGVHWQGAPMASPADTAAAAPVVHAGAAPRGRPRKRAAPTDPSPTHTQLAGAAGRSGPWVGAQEAAGGLSVTGGPSSARYPAAKRIREAPSPAALPPKSGQAASSTLAHPAGPSLASLLQAPPTPAPPPSPKAPESPPPPAPKPPVSLPVPVPPQSAAPLRRVAPLSLPRPPPPRTCARTTPLAQLVQRVRPWARWGGPRAPVVAIVGPDGTITTTSASGALPTARGSAATTVAGRPQAPAASGLGRKPPAGSAPAASTQPFTLRKPVVAVVAVRGGVVHPGGTSSGGLGSGNHVLAKTASPVVVAQGSATGARGAAGPTAAPSTQGLPAGAVAPLVDKCAAVVQVPTATAVPSGRVLEPELEESVPASCGSKSPDSPGLVATPVLQPPLGGSSSSGPHTGPTTALSTVACDGRVGYDRPAASVTSVLPTASVTQVGCGGVGVPTGTAPSPVSLPTAPRAASTASGRDSGVPPSSSSSELEGTSMSPGPEFESGLEDGPAAAGPAQSLRTPPTPARDGDGDSDGAPHAPLHLHTMVAASVQPRVPADSPGSFCAPLPVGDGGPTGTGSVRTSGPTGWRPPSLGPTPRVMFPQAASHGGPSVTRDGCFASGGPASESVPALAASPTGTLGPHPVVDPLAGSVDAPTPCPPLDAPLASLPLVVAPAAPDTPRASVSGTAASASGCPVNLKHYTVSEEASGFLLGFGSTPPPAGSATARSPPVVKV